MTVLAEMYETAYLNDIVVDCVKLHKTASLSLMDDDGDCFIALDPYRLGSEQNEVLQIAHELGHCMTGSFYNRYSSLNCISQKEYRADKWAVHKLIPFAELQRAFSEGVVDRWELAERFAVTEAFIETALHVYRREGKLRD